MLPIFLLVVISGCSSGGSPSLGNGVVIEAFEPDFRQVYSTEPVQLQLKIKNTGSVDATDTKLTLLNLDSEWAPSNNCNPGKLLAPDLERGTSGGSSLCLIDMKAPKLPKGLSTTYNPVARISYTYNSQLIKSISVVPQAEARRLQNTGKALPAETVSSTSGPISISVETKGPIRVFGTEVEFPLEVKFSNIGGGTVCNEDCASPENWNKLKYDVSSTVISNDCPDNVDITLFKGQTNTITCIGRAENVEFLTPASIQVSANYNYFIDSETSITVTGIEAA